METVHFRLLTDAAPERGVEIARRLEDFRGVFARLAPSLELRSPAPTTLFAFRDAESYAPYKTRADAGRSRVLGQFARTRDGNYLTLDASSQLADAFTVIYHEYVHFLVTHNFPRVPLWFNEGLAEYYSTFAIDGDRAYLGEPVERHRRYLAREGDFSLDELIEADTRSDAYHDPDQVGRFYALSWALVHYLMSGGGEEIERMADYFVRLDEGEPPARAFEAAFGRYLSTVEDELRTYLQTANFATTRVGLPSAPPAARVLRLSPADALYHLGDLLVHLGRPARAEPYFYAALEQDPRHAEAHGGLAHVRDLSNRWAEAESLYREAVKLGPRTALTWVLYGRHS
ncbi:MAG: tetratricopeptide repeat protein, partial [Holophagales bacterium]|nr:tetratricopeptide repeat protein [Holophagales bacterium]